MLLVFIQLWPPALAGWGPKYKVAIRPLSGRSYLLVTELVVSCVPSLVDLVSLILTELVLSCVSCLVQALVAKLFALVGVQCILCLIEDTHVVILSSSSSFI